MRKRHIDYLKGLAIILVVLGHSLQSEVQDYQNNILFRYIYSFHMPLFMWISGYLSYKDKLHFSSVAKRFFQLIIPFFAWFIVLTIPKGGNFLDQLITLCIHPDTGLWFFWVLFFISALFYFADSLAKLFKMRQEIVIALMAIVLNGILYVTNFRMLGYQFIAWYFIFYSIGFYFRKVENNLTYWLKNHTVQLLVVFLFVVTGFFWTQKGSPTFYQYLNLGGLFVYLYKIIVAMLGIAMLYILSKKLIQ